MDQSNIKRRDVMNFDEFKESYDQARKTVMLKKGEKAHPGTHEIQGEGLYVRNDANPYKAFGIPHNEKEANANDKIFADRVHVYDGKADGKDLDGKDGSYGTKDKAADKAAKKVADLVVNTMQSAAILLDENAKYDIDDLNKNLEKPDENK